MSRIWCVSLCVAWAAAQAACGPIGATVDNNNVNQNGNQNWNQNVNTNVDAAVVGGLVTLRGTVWSPGADQSGTLEVNRFPIPGASVVAFHAPPADLPQGMYCNECVEVPGGTPNTFADPITGEFELQLMPNRTYYLAIQKGEFRRVREINVPDLGDQVWEISFTAGGPRPTEYTLPSKTDLGLGDNVPKIAVVDANYEDMSIMFEALGFLYDSADVAVVQPSIVNDRAQLDQYNLVVVPCGENWPGGNGAVLKQWVQDGGKLYVDDFNYDFVEQVWPEFLSWYVEDGGFMGGSTGPCATSATPGTAFNSCNNWSIYEFNGDPGDADFASWLALPGVNQGGPPRARGGLGLPLPARRGHRGRGRGVHGQLRPQRRGVPAPEGVDVQQRRHVL